MNIVSGEAIARSPKAPLQFHRDGPLELVRAEIMPTPRMLPGQWAKLDNTEDTNFSHVSRDQAAWTTARLQK